MSEPITPLYPKPAGPRPLQGCYLEAPLAPPERRAPFVYANFVASLDGRISVPAPNGGQTVPHSIANPRDWRLLQELAGHADLLLSSGRYLRELDAGSAQDILPVGEGAAFADIRQWRAREGLAPQPDVAVFSASLDFPVPQRLLDQGRRLIVLTGDRPEAGRARRLEAAGACIVRVGSGPRPQGAALHEALAGLGYRRIYGVTGPYVLHTLLAAGVVDSLFLTTVHRMLGGKPFTTPCEGELLAAPADFRLRWLYLDAAGPDGVTQTFARYDRRTG
ncbi:RibD family protein [Spiribacter halobius]|uniref:Pyrimidine reductase n=1 Tax=Sediminicurvatus halobius TaxID=2182432 RepID=A0A2U2N8U4_9GAMM|nr:dihydrofolate reductase family protein [Spiribacter halobius]PWG65512.1 pyrimidine reductase [Spiribacter halobius]UEX76536.1 dihydrofolate reductase family protein [Spiribacter halobius]